MEAITILINGDRLAYHRQLHRGLKDLQCQQTEGSNCINNLLASQGLAAPMDAHFRATLAALWDWDLVFRCRKSLPAIS